MTEEILKTAKIEDLCGDTRFIANGCGLEIALLVWNKLKGCQLYIPTKPFIEAEKRYILRNIGFKPVMTLSIETGMTMRFIRKIKEEAINLNEFSNYDSDQCYCENNIYSEQHKDIQLKDLTGDALLMAEQLGVENFYVIWKECQGTYLNISDSDMWKVIERYISNNYKKLSINQLAIAVEMTNRKVCKVIANCKKSKNKSNIC